MQDAAAVRIGTNETGAVSQLLGREAQFLHRAFDRLHRQHRRAEKPIRVRLAVIREPPVVRAASRGREFGVIHPAEKQAKTRIEERRVDSLGVHIRDARMGVEAAFAPLGVWHPVLDRAVARADRPKATETNLIFAAAPLNHVAFAIDTKTFGFGRTHELGTSLAELRLDVSLPKVGGFEDVTVCVNTIISPGHCAPLFVLIVLDSPGYRLIQVYRAKHYHFRGQSSNMIAVADAPR